MAQVETDCSIRRLGSPSRIVNGSRVVARLHLWCHASDGLVT